MKSPVKNLMLSLLLSATFLSARSECCYELGVTTGIAYDTSGNVYVTGYFYEVVNFDLTPSCTGTLTSAGGFDVFIAKYDASGNLIYVKGMGGPQDDMSSAIAIDGSGNILITGHFMGSADFDPSAGTFKLTSASGGIDIWGDELLGTDIFVAKYDGSGNLIYAKRMGGKDYDYGYSLTLDGSGNTYITGSFRTTVDFDPGASVFNLTSAGWDDIFIAKYDASGNFMYATRIGGTDYDSGSLIKIDGNGNAYLSGSFNGTVDFNPGAGTATLTSVSFADAFFAKYDALGNYVYAKSLGDANCSSIAIDGSGNACITGSFYGTVDFDPGAGTANLTSAGYGDIFIAKYNAGGNYVYAKRIGGSEWYDTGNSVALDANGNILITGYFSGTVDFDPGAGIFNLSNASEEYYYSDIFLAKYDAAGNFVYAKPMGGSGDDGGVDLVIDGSGNVLISGLLNGTADFDPGVDSANITGLGIMGNYFVGKYNASGNYIWAFSPAGFQFSQSLTLVNADTETDITELKEAAVIDLSVTPHINIRADFCPFSNIESVKFMLNGSFYKIENTPFYTIAGDDNGNYHPWTLPVGHYSLCAIPYTGNNATGVSGNHMCIRFTVVDAASYGVTHYTLVNAETDEDILHFYGSSAFADDADVRAFDLTALPHPERITIRANTYPPVVPSLSFEVDIENNFYLENNPPYAMFGDNNGDYKPWQNFEGVMGGSCQGYNDFVPHHCLVQIYDDEGNLAASDDFNFRFYYSSYISSLTLVNAITGQDIVNLYNGSVVDLSTLPTNKLNIRAYTYPPVVGSVVFGDVLVNPVVENTPPYALYGDGNGNYNSWLATPGVYHVEATPYSLPQNFAVSGWPKGVCGYSTSVSFELIQSGTNKMSAQDEATMPSALQVYPNPNAGVFDVAFITEETADVKVEVYDLLGKMVYHNELRSFSGAYSKQLDLSMYGQGIYLLKVQEGGETYTRKIVVNP